MPISPKSSLSLPPKRESDRFSVYYAVTPPAFWKHPLVKVLQRFIPPESLTAEKKAEASLRLTADEKYFLLRRSRPGKLSLSLAPFSLLQHLRLDHPRFPKVNLIQKRRDFVTRFQRALFFSPSLLFLSLSLSLSSSLSLFLSLSSSPSLSIYLSSFLRSFRRRCSRMPKALTTYSRSYEFSVAVSLPLKYVLTYSPPIHTSRDILRVFIAFSAKITLLRPLARRNS